MAAPDAKIRLRIWDWPTRLGHWLIAGLVAGLWWTGEHDQLPLHRACGYVLLALVLFRIIWGVVGGSTARFTSFLRGPRAVAAYLADLVRGRTGAVIGHNPLGGWSVAAMLALLATDAGLGLFAVNEDGDQPGPLARFVSFDQGQAVAQWHHWVFNALLVLIGLHLAAIAFYALVKRDNLLAPMFTGAKAVDGEAAPLRPAPLWRVLAAAAAATALTLLIVWL